jgi:multidrug resistance efflux pump
VAFAEQEAANKEELYRLDATTAQEVLRLKTQLESGKSALAEARLQLMLARQDLEACDVKAPFSGYLAARYKQPNEPVHALDRLFSLVDSARVYAVAHVPEDLLSAYRIGTKCLFVRRGGEEHSGQVERIGKILDPKTKAKKVHVLIDNSDGLLEIGMTGFLGLAREE